MIATLPEAPLAGGTWRVVRTFVLLVGVLGGLAALAAAVLRPGVDGVAKVREYFGERPPPFGLELVAATRTSQGLLVRLQRAGEGAEGASGPSEVAFLEPGSRPAAQALLRASLDANEAEKRVAEWERDPSFELVVTRKSSEFAFGPWISRLLVQRAFAKGGGWREEARVDLSAGARALVLFAHWPSGVPADEDELRALLSAVVLTPGDT
jgi:hypothetical protein